MTRLLGVSRDLRLYCQWLTLASVHASAWRTAFTFLPSRFLEAIAAGSVLAKWEADLGLPTTSMFVAVSEVDVIGFLQVRVDRWR